jgi:hypothetical protein
MTIASTIRVAADPISEHSPPRWHGQGPNDEVPRVRRRPARQSAQRLGSFLRIGGIGVFGRFTAKIAIQRMLVVAHPKAIGVTIKVSQSTPSGPDVFGTASIAIAAEHKHTHIAAHTGMARVIAGQRFGPHILVASTSFAPAHPCQARQPTTADATPSARSARFITVRQP